MNVNTIYIYTPNNTVQSYASKLSMFLFDFDGFQLGFVDDWYCVFVLFCAEQFVLLANGNTTH